MTAEVDEGLAYVATLPAELHVQARLLRRLLDEVAGDARWAWLELGCSVAAGRADALSDLDLGLGCVGEAPPLDDVTAMLRRLGPVIEVAAAPWDGVPRWFAQYADGGQIDLLVVPAEVRPGRAPGAVALLDRSGRLRREFEPSVRRARPGEPRAWLLDGWEALGNVAKYLDRGSVLEALQALERARGRALQLHAVAADVDYPSFGLTSLLDAEHPSLPPDIEATWVPADAEQVRAAARLLADVLAAAADRAESGLDTPLRPWVLARLG